VPGAMVREAGWAGECRDFGVDQDSDG